MRRRRRVWWIGALLGVGAWVPSALAQPPCGPEPLPEPGCVMGPCVGGRWVQECPYNDPVACGPKPIPGLGCLIGGCVDGRWEQICDVTNPIECGPEPELPPVGCRVGDCVAGDWELICNEPIPNRPLRPVY
ncbi:MAG: hypothetical protein OEM05_01770 [Myxococcales bacterium]|nr:hypothetical protein [Myxococcales bacterium]